MQTQEGRSAAIKKMWKDGEEKRNRHVLCRRKKEKPPPLRGKSTRHAGPAGAGEEEDEKLKTKTDHQRI